MPIAPSDTVVGTGGTLTTVRAMEAARRQVRLEETQPRVGVPLLREILLATGPKDLADRRRIPGLPPGRADVFPAALATLLTVAEVGRFVVFHHSLRNLRWGVASEMFDSPGARPN
jgi:exopolyphosphatase/guanosine-5'-triphosphate,3'-diphosphate pyrophosphatase